MRDNRGNEHDEHKGKDMTHTREQAISKLTEYRCTGMVFQYTVSGTWNWATTGSGVYADIVGSLTAEGAGVINPDYLGGIVVSNVELFTEVPETVEDTWHIKA